MRIIQVISSLAVVGGAERFVIDLSIALMKLGHQVRLIVLYNDKINFFQAEADEHNLDIVYLNKKKGVDFINSLLLKKEILHYRPDAVNTHIQSHLSMKLSGVWKKKYRIKYFHTIHNVPYEECKKPLLFSIMKPLYRKGIVTPIAISDSLAKQTKEYYQLNYTPFVIYNGIFFGNFENKNSIHSRINTFISVASFQAKKNQLNIAKATIALKNKGYDVNTIFLGGGTEFENVRKFVVDNNAEGFVTFAGQVKNVGNYLKNSKCLVIPSLYEGNPISILEAMAAGLGIIATNVGGPKDIITDDENGYLVNPLSLEDLTGKMEKILNDPSILERFSNNNIKKVKIFDMMNVAKKYFEIYKRQNQDKSVNNNNNER